jgi:hypothetical protein
MSTERLPWLVRKERRDHVRDLRELVVGAPPSAWIRRFVDGTDKEREAIDALWTLNGVWPAELDIANWIIANP